MDIDDGGEQRRRQHLELPKEMDDIVLAPPGDQVEKIKRDSDASYPTNKAPSRQYGGRRTVTDDGTDALITKRISVSYEVAQVIIGYHGLNSMRLETISGAKVSADHAPNDDTGEHAIVISGFPKAVEKAIDLINEDRREIQAYNISIPRHRKRLWKSQKLKILQRFNAFIKFDDADLNDTPFRTITITGAPRAIEETISYINGIAEARR